MLAAAAELRAQDPALRRLSPRWVRALVHPWYTAGWTNTDVLIALNNTPHTGGPRPADRCPAPLMRRPDGWIRHRMRAWLDTATGQPLQAPQQWALARRAVQARHGHSAGARLRYGHTQLHTEDLPVQDTQRREAAQLLARRRAGELTDTRNAPRAAEDATDPDTRARYRAAIQASLAKARGDVDTPEPGAGSLTATAEAATPASAAGKEPDISWRRALARARDEAGRPRGAQRAAGWRRFHRDAQGRDAQGKDPQR